MLTDTGPLIAIISKTDNHHTDCVRVLNGHTEPLTTTLPCFTEAMYFAHGLLGYSGQNALWKMVRAGRLLLHTTTGQELERIDQLMSKYRDTPMDFADASLIAAAETLQTDSIFSIDGDFRIYQLAGGRFLSMVP